MNGRFRFAGFIAAPMLAAGCSDGMEPSVDETESAEIDTLESSTDDYGIEAKDFDNLQLGGKIEGPAGPEMKASLTVMRDGDEASVSAGDITAFVACPEKYDSCVPADLPSGTIYTYVYRLTPGVDEPNEGDFPKPGKVVPIDEAESFRMVLPAKGYAGNAGYSLTQARAALGSQGSFAITCDEGMLTWKVASGERWQTGEPVTFYWQSTDAPIGPMDAFIMTADGMEAVAPGPSPTTRGETDLTGCT